MPAGPATLRVRLEGLSDPGRVRPNNEDYWGATPDSRVFAVADGVGGRRNGDVASRTAVETFLAAVARGGGDPEALLRAAIAEANAALTWTMPSQTSGSDMSTTLVGALVRGDQLHIANVGDSRAYLIRGGNMRQLTRDHTALADEVERGGIGLNDPVGRRFANVITRSLGRGGAGEPDVFSVGLSVGDRVLLCTDGLSRQVDEDTIRRIAGRGPTRKAVQDLVERANAAGGKDNVTVVIAEIESEGEQTVTMPAISGPPTQPTPRASSLYSRSSSSSRGPLPPNTLLIGGGVLALLLLCGAFSAGLLVGRGTAPSAPAAGAAVSTPGVAGTPAPGSTPAAAGTPAAIAGGTPAAGGGATIRETLRNSTGGFVAREGEQRATADGYVMAALNGATWAFLGDAVFADFIMEADCQLVSAVDAATCGLVYRVQDDSNWYKVSVEPLTQRVVVNSLINGVRRDSFNQAGVAAVRRGTESNTLRVVANGTSMTFSVNGQEVHTFTDETFSRGMVGLIANALATPAEVRYTRFELTQRP